MKRIKYTPKKIYKGIRKRVYRKYIKTFGKLAYKTYWHLRLHGMQRNPNYSNFYLAARPNPGAGIGHQMANWIAGYWYAKTWGIKFAHIPFSTQKWENFLGFGIGEITIPELKRNGWKVRRIPIFNEGNQEEIMFIKDIMSSYSGQKIIFLCEQDQFYCNQYGVMTEIQEKFYKAPTRKGQNLQYSKDNLNIAIHVRRGDIMEDPSNPNLAMRYLSNDYFEKVLGQVIKHLSKSQNKPIHIWLFSQGQPKEYSAFEKFGNLHMCLNMGAIDSFLHMVYADVLITSKSSFSYKPALLNKNGIKVCPKNFWHGYPKTQDWILVDNEGNVEWK